MKLAGCLVTRRGKNNEKMNTKTGGKTTRCVIPFKVTLFDVEIRHWEYPNSFVTKTPPPPKSQTWGHVSFKNYKFDSCNMLHTGILTE